MLLFLFFSAPRTFFHDCSAHHDALGHGATVEQECSVCGIPMPVCVPRAEVPLVGMPVVAMEHHAPVTRLYACEVQAVRDRGPPVVS